MTPFDAAACLAMLLAFYPIVGPAALARARSERPEYFAGATLIGRGGDKFQLPDGRIFDCIFDVGGRDSHWQMIDVASGGGGAVDPFELEEGPLTTLDESSFPTPPPPGHDFETLVGEKLTDLGDADTTYAQAIGTIGGAADPEPLSAAYEATVSRAAQAVSEQSSALDQIDPSDVIANSTGHRDFTFPREAEWVDETPPIDTSPDPGVEPPGGPEFPGHQFQDGDGGRQ